MVQLPIHSEKHGPPVLDVRRRWHRDCLAVFKLVTFPEAARWHVERRDNGICARCGAPPSYIPRKGVECTILEMGWRRERDGQYPSMTEIIWVADWHVDHIVPLWKVADLPDDERLVYFLLENLQTLCSACHKLKNAAEAAERAQLRREAR